MISINPLANGYENCKINAQLFWKANIFYFSITQNVFSCGGNAHRLIPD